MEDNQNIQIHLFQESILQADFYNYAKIHHNGIYKNKEEQYNLEIMKEFEALRVKPTAIYSKIQNNHLILENDAVTESETIILNKYL